MGNAVGRYRIGRICFVGLQPWSKSLGVPITMGECIRVKKRAASKLVSIKASRESYHEKLPDLELLFKYELSACTQEEIVNICQGLIESGKINQFDHPLRRTAYDLAAAGMVVGLEVPPGYVALNNDADRETILNVTAH